MLLSCELWSGCRGLWWGGDFVAEGRSANHDCTLILDTDSVVLKRGWMPGFAGYAFLRHLHLCVNA